MPAGESKLILGARPTITVGAGADVTLSAQSLAILPFHPTRLSIVEGSGWLVKSLRFETWGQQLADPSPLCPAEIFAPPGGPLDLPVLRPTEWVHLVLVNSSDAPRDAPHVELIGWVK